MRGSSSGMVLGAAGICVLAIILALVLVSGKPENKLASTSVVEVEEKSASAIVVEVVDNPPSLRAATNEKPDTTASLNRADDESTQDQIIAEPTVPENLFIADAVRLKLSDPVLSRGAHSDDLAAVEAFYSAHNGPALWMTTTGISPEGKAVLAEVAKASDWGLEPGIFMVPPLDYQPTVVDDQAATEVAISLAILKYARYARGGRVNPSALSKLIDQKPPLRDPKVVLSEIASEGRPEAYLMNLHPKHPQFALLHKALLNARAEGEVKPKNVENILINMERWRWMPEDLGSFHVWLNTPEFMAHVVKEGKVVHSEKMVVGKPRYATPVFSADMKNIVFNPKWTVPPTIVREDLLPKLRKGGGGWFGGGGNTAVLKQHRLKVFYKGREVDPKKVNWKKVNMSAISFVQAPGPKNYLGKVKFIYPNKHIVYMHDTIKRDLLKKEVRAEGHNCPRVDNPGKVAAVLLSEDKGWDKSKVDQLLKKGYDSSVNLDDPIPVHTTYFTAVVDPDGRVKIFSDIYKLDGVIVRALFDKKNASQATPEESTPAPPWTRNNQESLAVSAP